MTYAVSTEIINPFGICLGEVDAPDYAPYATIHMSAQTNRAAFHTGLGTYINGSAGSTHFVTLDVGTMIEDYIRRVYELSDDVVLDVTLNYSAWRLVGTRRFEGTQQTFETEAEALEYVDTLGNPEPIWTWPRYTSNTSQSLATVGWRQEIDGVFIDRNVDLIYTGDQVSLYTISDLVNFLALFLEVTPEEVWNAITYELNSNITQDIPEPSYDCEPYIKATVVDIDGPGNTIEIDIDFTGSSIGDVTVTVIDGDSDAPIVTNRLENGSGVIEIADSGNISMRNDGGTFYLNEYYNAGFFAEGDVSLTADQTVMIAAGGARSQVLSIGSHGFFFSQAGNRGPDGTYSVTLTMDDIRKLKALVTDEEASE